MREGTNDSERKDDLGDDLYGGRRPTSHERMAGQPWDVSYHGGRAPWDIGGPQPAIAQLIAEGAFSGAVLDAGCGTGENALAIASLGLSVVGVDVAETAVTMARAKARERGADAEFVVADAFHLERLRRVFDSVLDCGLFHALDESERREYAASLAAVTRAGGSAHLLCFSDVGEELGPHPVSERELRAVFEAHAGWRVVSIAAERVHTRFHASGAPAWLAKVERV
ncbi:MAG TPA: class I SAM-dependent methyltransferase [Terracidiphilus sp.]|nr:class I SAM-dependent methyltransferase [Terracidiphilus sp.]